jgi:hypothetical protein
MTLAEASLKDPFIALRIWQPKFPHDIQMHTREKHFMIILNIQNTQKAFESIEAIDKHLDFHPITRQEVSDAITTANNKKETGPDTSP